MMTTSQSNQKDVTNILSSLKNIVEAVTHAASAGTIEEVLQQIANVAKQVVHVRYAALGVPDGRGSLRYFKTVGVTDEEIKRIGHHPQGLGLLGAIMHERETLRLKHLSDDPRSVGFPPNHPPMSTLLGVPIMAGNQLFGMLYLCDRTDGKPFSEEDQWLLETFAGYAALAIAGVQLGEQQGRLILLEERERVAMELHDGIIQSLYAIGMQLQLARMSSSNLDGDLTEAIHNLDTVIEDIRRYIMNLKVANYQQQTIYSCLRDLTARLRLGDYMTVQIDALDRLPPFSPPVFEAVCQIAQEALSNVLRHSQAKHVKVTALQNDTVFQMIIQDDGKGFDLDSLDNSEGMGLRNIQQRTRIHGGKIHIHSALGRGTRLTLQIPIKKPL
ncbi:MAG: GAF domain-containing sensor histidine kinase [Chloroflexi bacterium]|nr:GAF domain-containing sensor histidine kinase [Chloroflexota bacterium]